MTVVFFFTIMTQMNKLKSVSADKNIENHRPYPLKGNFTNLSLLPSADLTVDMKLLFNPCALLNFTTLRTPCVHVQKTAINSSYINICSTFFSSLKQLPPAQNNQTFYHVQDFKRLIL